MSEVKFSEGPWSTYGDWGVKSFGKRDCFVSVEDQGEGPSATTEKIANMHLIAAAPEMYRILELAMSYMDGDSIEDFVYSYQDIKQLLAKARGE